MELVGQTKGSQDVEIRARVEGFLDTVAFTEGTLVRKGQLLYQIDPKPLEATLANAKADLATAQARLEKTKNDVKRLTPLADAAGRQPAGARQRRRRPGRGPRPGGRARRRRSTRRRSTSATRTITSPIDGLVGTTKVKAGQPGRARREHAAHDGLADRPDPVPRRASARPSTCGSRGESPSRAARSEAAKARDRADPGRRHRAPAQGPPRRDRARRRPDHRHARGAVHVPQPRAPRAARPVRPRALRDRDEEGRAARAAARGAGAAEPLQRRGRRRRQQGRRSAT